MYTNSNDIIIEKLIKEDQRDISERLIQRAYLKQLNLARKNAVILNLVNRIGVLLVSSGEKMKKFAERQSQKNSQTLVTS